MKRLSMAMTALAVLGLMTMVSCRKPNVNNVVPGAARTVTFNATTESGNGSKTYLEDRYVNWSKGDQISVNGSTFTLSSGEGTTFGSFTGTITGIAPYLAGYPQASTTYTAEPKSLKLNLPAIYTYNDSKVEIPMVAITNSEDGDLSFRNAVNVLKLKLTGDGEQASNLKSIVLKSSTSKLNGDIAVTFSGATPTFGYADGATTTTVNFEGGKQLDGTAEDVYIVLPKIDGGELTIKFNCSNDKYMKKKITVTPDFNAVNNILRTPELKVDAQTTPVDVDPDVTTNDVCYNCQYIGASGIVTSSTTQECEYGFVYAKTAKNADPTIGGSHCVKDIYATGEVTKAGITYSKDLELEVSVEYSFKAYAIGENGNVQYGEVKTITGGDTPKDVIWNGGGTQGASPYEFAVRKVPQGTATVIKTVRFSQGNLQYVGSTGTWKFADHQFDVLGKTTNQDSDFQTVDRDLFGWGTSGWDNRNHFYQPYNTDKDTYDWSVGNGYGPTNGSSYWFDLTGDYANSDWGVHNAITNGGNAAGMWRTLTSAEWDFLINKRPDAGTLYGHGKVGCTNGLIILPNGWNWGVIQSLGLRYPEGTGDLKFTVGVSTWLNTYSYSDWSTMESYGAVFLPTAGYRGGTSLSDVGSCGKYWSSSCYYDNALYLNFNSGNVSPQNNLSRFAGFSVRLVRDAD